MDIDNTWNMDKKGFTLEKVCNNKVIILVNILAACVTSGENRNSVIIVEVVLASRQYIPLIVIFSNAYY